MRQEQGNTKGTNLGQEHWSCWEKEEGEEWGRKRGGTDLSLVKKQNLLIRNTYSYIYEHIR